MQGRKHEKRACSIRGAASRAVDLRTHDVAVLQRALWAAVYGEQHVPARRDRRHRRDMRSRDLNQTERDRFRAAARRHAPPLAWIGRNTPPLFCIHLVVLNAAPWSVLFAWCDVHAMTIWPVMLVIHALRSSVLTGMKCVMSRPLTLWFFTCLERGRRCEMFKSSY